mgnify:CR=1 FL=1
MIIDRLLYNAKNFSKQIKEKIKPEKKEEPYPAAIRDRVLELIKFNCYRKGDFTLSSGRKTEHYVNCKSLTLHSEGLVLISKLLLHELQIRRTLVNTPRTVAGLTLGADPLVCGVIAESHYQSDIVEFALIVRKEPKGYGTNAWIEGRRMAEKGMCIMLEDVITTGASVIKAAEKVREAGYVVTEVLTLVDRQENGEADAALKEAGLELISLYKLDELI